MDLTTRQRLILELVEKYPDMSQTFLVKKSGMDRSTLADVVRRLTHRKLLKRRRTKEMRARTRL
ncbi:MarR family transcriptional regulator [bacterium]|nr:MarR family transcriptional regulator [bacterium]